MGRKMAGHLGAAGVVHCDPWASSAVSGHRRRVPLSQRRWCAMRQRQRLRRLRIDQTRDDGVKNVPTSRWRVPRSALRVLKQRAVVIVNSMTRSQRTGGSSRGPGEGCSRVCPREQWLSPIRLCNNHIQPGVSRASCGAHQPRCPERFRCNAMVRPEPQSFQLHGDCRQLGGFARRRLRSPWLELPFSEGPQEAIQTEKGFMVGACASVRMTQDCLRL